MAQNTPGQQLSDLLVTRGYDPEMLDSSGKAAASAQDAEIFSFDFVTSNGTNHGTVVVMLGDDKELDVFSGDNVGRGMDSEDKTEWYEFQHQLKNFATKNFMTFGSQNINKLKFSMQGQAALKEGLCESWNGTKNISWNGGPDSVRLMIRHKRAMGVDEARFRQVESLFVETTDGERYRLPFRNLAGGRAMVEHVRQGGKPYDMRGQHIATVIEELNVLSRFRRASKGQVFEGDTANLVVETNHYYETMCRTVKGLSTSKGYNSYFESWNPADITEQDLIIEDIKTLFVQETIDSRIEQALPILARIQQQGTAMKEANIFEAWAERLVEGTWATPNTPEQKEQLIELLSKELPVGADATNATEQLYSLLGDDVLFDQLQELAEMDANADARQLIIDRMTELADGGLDTDIMEVLAALDTASVEQPSSDEEDYSALPDEAGDSPVTEGHGPSEAEQLDHYHDLVAGGMDPDEAESEAYGTTDWYTDSDDEQDPIARMMEMSGIPVAENDPLNRYRQRLHAQGFTDSPEERNADRLERKRRHNANLDKISNITGLGSEEEAKHQAQQRMARDAYELQRRKDNDEDTRKTFDMMRDRLNRMQYKNQRDVDPEQLAKISAIKYNPIREGMTNADYTPQVGDEVLYRHSDPRSKMMPTPGTVLAVAPGKVTLKIYGKRTIQDLGKDTIDLDLNHYTVQPKQGLAEADTGSIDPDTKCKTCGVPYKRHFTFDANGNIINTLVRHMTMKDDFPGMAGMDPNAPVPRPTKPSTTVKPTTPDLPRAEMVSTMGMPSQHIIGYKDKTYEPAGPYKKAPVGVTGTQVLVPAAAFGIRSSGDVVALLTDDGTAYAEQPIKVFNTMGQSRSQPAAEGAMDPAAESAELNTMLKYAGMPVAESRVLDEAGETIDHILNRFKHEVKQFEAGHDMDSDLYEALFDYYSDSGDMPYGIAKARTGDPFTWVSDQLAQHLGVNESVAGGILGAVGGAALTKTPSGAMAGARLGSAAQDAVFGGQEETDEGQHTQHGMDATPGARDYNDEKLADIRPMSFKQDPIQATTDRALKYGAQGVNKLRDLFREDEEAVVEDQDKFSALSGQYGHSGKLQKFDDVEQDVLARLKQLSGMIRPM